MLPITMARILNCKSKNVDVIVYIYNTTIKIQIKEQILILLNFCENIYLKLKNIYLIEEIHVQYIIKYDLKYMYENL